MRDFSAGHEWLSLNTMTVDRQGDLPVIVVRHAPQRRQRLAL